MKKIFSKMLLMAAVMVSTFTSCKNDDAVAEDSSAKKLAGSYTAEMSYAFQNTDLGSKSVTVNVSVVDDKHVNIEIPEIKDLAFQARMGQSTIDINVVDFGKYTIKNVPVISKDDVALASSITSGSEVPSIDVIELLSKYPYQFEVKDVPFVMSVRGNETKGKAVVSGEVIAMKVKNKFSVIYSFYPAESLKPMGISITGILVK